MILLIWSIIFFSLLLPPPPLFQIVISNSLWLISNHILFVTSKLLIELLFSELNERVFECVLGHKCSVELETLMLTRDLLKRVNLSLQLFHFLFDSEKNKLEVRNFDFGWHGERLFHKTNKIKLTQSCSY